jgi:hypothetical protein
MSLSTARSTNSTKSHNDVVNRVQGMLQESLDKAIENLQTLDNERTEVGAGPQPKLVRYQQGLDKHLQTVQALAAATDLALAGGSKGVREYLKRAESMRERLAQWAGRAIG